MPPTCDSGARGETEPDNNRQTVTAATAASGTVVTSSSSGKASASHALLCDVVLEADPGPFYGMFDREDDEEEVYVSSPIRQSTHAALPQSSPRGSRGNGASLPGASETFQRAMRQLDHTASKEEAGDEKSCGHPHKTTPKGAASSSETKRESRKASVKVKKSASFSATGPSPSSSSGSGVAGGSAASSGAAAEAKRRMSVPCLRGHKHVQWADEAGVSDLVSVRLIRPRLAKQEEPHAPAPAARSILRRLSGMR